MLTIQKKIKLDPYLTAYRRINKQIRGLNVKIETM